MVRASGGTETEWRRHGGILVPSLAGIILGSVNAYAFGTILPSIEHEFGWSRTEISGGPMLISVIALFCAPLIGALIDRVGARRIGLFGVVFFCSAMALLSTTTSNIMSWLGLWAVIGVAGMFIAPMVWTTAVNLRFDKNRGKALALVLCGTGVSSATVPMLTNALIESYGWRGAYLGLAMISATFALPLVFFMFRDLETPALDSRHPPKSGGRMVEVRQAFKSPNFLKLAGAIFVFSIAGCALTSNGVPILMGEGFDRGTAAKFAGLIGLGSICGRLAGGVLLDRFDAKKVAAVSVLAPIVTVSLFLATQGSETAAPFACFVVGLSAGAEVDCCAYLAARHFGMRNFATLFGALTGVMLLTTGLAPLLSNAVYDATGTYDLMLWAIMGLCLSAAALFLALGRYPDDPDPIEVSPDAATAAAAAG